VLERIPEAAESRLSWAPDNRHIVWDSAFPDRLGSHLYIADTERSTIHQITSGTVNEQSPSISPDGQKIAFAAGGNDSDLISVPLDGSAVQTLLASARSETRPTWSPNGNQLAYVTNAPGTPEIWVRSVEEGWTRPIVKRDSESPAWQYLQRPSFSPDGQRIVYEVWGAKHAVWVSSVADGRGVPLDPESPDEHSPAWSPDGKWIAYQRLSGSRWELVKVPSGGGTPVSLAEATPGGGDHTAWSPAGDWIAHVQGGTLRLTSANGQAQKTLSGPPPAVFGFSRDGSSLYAVRHASNGSWVLVEFDVQSQRERHVIDMNLPPKATLSGFSLHPNGKSFATGIGIARHDIWLLEGFEPPSRWFGRS
jgi:Tol biopolymer transport system component